MSARSRRPPVGVFISRTLAAFMTERLQPFYLCTSPVFPVGGGITLF